MNIHAGARRLLISFVCVFMAFLLLAGSFPAQASQADTAGEIPVVKRWEGEETLPERVTVKLLAGGTSIRTLTLTAAGRAASKTSPFMTVRAGPLTTPWPRSRWRALPPPSPSSPGQPRLPWAALGRR